MLNVLEVLEGRKEIEFMKCRVLSFYLALMMPVTTTYAQTPSVEDTITIYERGREQGKISMWDINNDSLWIQVEHVVVDTAKIESMVIEADKEKRAKADSIMQVERLGYEAQIAVIEALMEHETKKTVVYDEKQLKTLIWYRNHASMSESARNKIDKHRVPKGLTERYLLDAHAELQQKVTQIWDPYQPATWYDAYPYEKLYPKKKEQKRVRNPYCVDNYLNGYFSASSMDSKKCFYYNMVKGWEWAEREKAEQKEEHYPMNLHYSCYPTHPEYRFCGNEVYDKQGRLVRITWINGGYLYFGEYKKDIRKELLEQLCKRDFLANKYDINSAKKETLTALSIRYELANAVDVRFEKYMKMAKEARDEKVSATSLEQYNRAQKKQNEALNVLMEYVQKQREPQALKYIAQLEADHKDDFKYLYKIERLDDVTLKFYWLNSNLKCGCIAKIAWQNDGPYRTQYIIELLPHEVITIRR